MEKSTIEILGIITTITLAFLGYLITYLNDKRIHKREEKLKLINNRLEKLYGPLYFSTIAGETSYNALLKKLGRDMVNDNPSEEDLKEWRNWVINIFMPNNRGQRNIINNNAYLILEDKPPECFTVFVRHVSEFEAILNKWNNDDFSENFPSIDYPEDMQKYIHESYLRLKSEQIKLIE